MSESTRGGRTPVELLRSALADAGVPGALAEALRFAGLAEPPRQPEQLLMFLRGPVEEVLDGLLQPAEVASALAPVRVSLAAGAGDTRVTVTVSPPAASGTANAYEDLISGAVHSRVTPVWGVRLLDQTAPPGSIVWTVVSEDVELIRVAMSQAPRSVDVVLASSEPVFEAALSRARSRDCAVVLDGRTPSLAIERVAALIRDAPCDPRVVLWRISQAGRGTLLRHTPTARDWLACADEVTPQEILMLLGFEPA